MVGSGPGGSSSRTIEIRIWSMRVAIGVLRANGWLCVRARPAATRPMLRLGSRAVLAAAHLALLLPAAARGETLADALVRTYRNNPQLNSERARLRGVDESVPQALA